MTAANDAVLVTGAAGFVGRALCAALAARGLEVIAADRAFAPAPPAARVRQVVCDLTRREQVEALFAAARPRAVVHGGGVSGPMIGRRDPHAVFDVNVGGTLHLLEGARRAGVARLLLLSSIAAYGDQQAGGSIDEDAPLLAIEPYGASKAAAERVALSYRESFGMEVAALRITSIYGPGREAACLVRSLLQSTLSPDLPPVEVSTAPASVRQLLHVDDCVAAVLGALRAPSLARFAYNVGSGECVTEAELARRIETRFGPVRVAPSAAPRYFDGRLGCLDIARARTDWGFIPQVTLEDGLAGLHARLADSAEAGRRPASSSGASPVTSRSGS